MDTVSEDTPGYENLNSATNVTMLKNQGYIQFVNVSPQNLQLSSGSTSGTIGYNYTKLPEETRARKQLFTKPTQEPQKPNLVEQVQQVEQVEPVEQPLSSIKVDNAKETKKTDEPEEKDYIEHVTRLQNKITEFGNVKDSIDIRKSKNKGKSSSPSSKSESPKKVENLTTSEKLKELTKERTKQKNLIHEMVMDKLKTEKKIRRSKPEPLQKSSTDSMIPVYATVNKKLSPKKEEPVQRHSVVFNTDPEPTFKRSSSINEHLLFSIKSTSPDYATITPPDLISSTSSSKKPNRTKSFSEISKNDVQSLGIQKSVSGNVLSDLLRRNRDSRDSGQYFKSEPCLAEKRRKSLSIAGQEKRKSIIQAVTDFFHKRKSESPEVTSTAFKSSRSNSSPGDSSSKERFSLFRISPKSREKAKVFI